MLKRALFASAALVIGTMYMQGAITPASAAGPNIKPKVKVAPKPRIRVIKPKIRLKVDPKRLLENKAPVKDPAKSGVAATITKPKIDSRDLPPGFAANAERLAELGEIGAFKEHIEDILGMLAIAGLEGALDIPGLSDLEAGPDSRPDYSGVASGLLDGVSGGLGSGEKMGGAVTSPGSPSDAVGGIASQRSSPWRGISWQQADNGDRYRVRTIRGTNGFTRITETRTTGGGHYTEWQTRRIKGNDEDFIVFHRDDRQRTEERARRRAERDSGDGGKPDSGDGGKPDSGDKVKKPKDIAKLQDPDAGGGTVVWIPPSCGSATCNGIRAYLSNPEGTLRQYIATKSTRVRGDRGGDPNTGTSRLEIDQHGLIVSYGADSGPARTGGRVRRYDGPTRIVK